MNESNQTKRKRLEQVQTNFQASSNFYEHLDDLQKQAIDMDFVLQTKGTFGKDLMQLHQQWDTQLFQTKQRLSHTMQELEDEIKTVQKEIRKEENDHDRNQSERKRN